MQWKANTRYDGHNSDDQVIIWFWETVNTFSYEQKDKLLQFALGTSILPPDGFENLGRQDEDVRVFFNVCKHGNRADPIQSRSKLFLQVY